MASNIFKLACLVTRRLLSMVGVWTKIQTLVEPIVNTSTAVSDEKISVALRIILDRRNHPILIHCNKGKVAKSYTYSTLDYPCD